MNKEIMNIINGIEELTELADWRARQHLLRAEWALRDYGPERALPHITRALEALKERRG